MQVYITKYALTRGIIATEAEKCDPTDMISTKDYYYQHKPHWHESLQDAIAQAEKMRLKKIASLEKQLKKIKEISFKD